MVSLLKKHPYTSAFLSHWIQILANSSPKSDIFNKKKTKNLTLFFRILRSVGRGQHKFFYFFGLIINSLSRDFKHDTLHVTKICRPIYMYTLLEYDVTRRDSLSVVMDAGSRIVNFNFIRDDRYSLCITLKYTTLVRMCSGSAWTDINDNGAEVTNGLQ